MALAHVIWLGEANLAILILNMTVEVQELCTSPLVNTVGLEVKKHSILGPVHPDEEPNFKTQITKGGIFFNVERQIQESIDIDEARQNIDVNLLNQRSEWGQRGLVRLVVEQ